MERVVFKESDMKILLEAGAIGEICGRYFDKNGKECDTPFADRVASISFDDIRKSALPIAVTVGTDRADALYAAIKGKLVKSVIIDDAGAQALLDRAKTSGK